MLDISKLVDALKVLATTQHLGAGTHQNTSNMQTGVPHMSYLMFVFEADMTKPQWPGRLRTSLPSSLESRPLEFFYNCRAVKM